MKYKKLLILCKGNSVTGGSELVHQLCHELSNLNLKAYVCYYPFHINYKIPDEYEIYNVKQCDFEDDPENIVILPEVSTKYAWRIRKSMIGIWWLSVDNYYRKKRDNFIKDQMKYLKDLIRLRLMPIFLMKKYLHFVQSKFAYDHLKSHRLTSEFLSDYLNPIHFKESKLPKDNIILYNPVKGKRVTQKLIDNNKDLNFIALENLSNKEVQELFNRAKLYIDFGNHPGKDRMPREAVMANCCIITGKRGSAKNNIDIPISTKYKFDDKEMIDNSSFRNLVKNIFSNFEDNLNNFADYKNKIINEKNVFQKQVKTIFTKILNDT
tara:strand:- start:101 stop:1069 length:969 start_codon:yes stop_codon:yes gene_type:complete